jgi:hypothetical protein
MHAIVKCKIGCTVNIFKKSEIEYHLILVCHEKYKFDTCTSKKYKVGLLIEIVVGNDIW